MHSESVILIIILYFESFRGIFLLEFDKLVVPGAKEGVGKEGWGMELRRKVDINKLASLRDWLERENMLFSAALLITTRIVVFGGRESG